MPSNATFGSPSGYYDHSISCNVISHQPNQGPYSRANPVPSLMNSCWDGIGRTKREINALGISLLKAKETGDLE